MHRQSGALQQSALELGRDIVHAAELRRCAVFAPRDTTWVKFYEAGGAHLPRRFELLPV